MPSPPTPSVNWAASQAWPIALGLAAIGLLLAGLTSEAAWLWLGAAVAGASGAWAGWRSRRPAGPAPVTPDPQAGQAEALWRAALERLPDPVLIVEGGDPEDVSAQRIRFANEQARSQLRIFGERAVLVSVLRDPEALEAIDEALFGGLTRDIGFSAGGAQERVWRLSATPLPPGKEDAPQVLVRLRDDTEAARMERMRADFLANASHELKTPLASLAGFIETLKGHARDDDRARDRFLDIMTAQTARMSRLIADLLSLSRIELNEHVPPSGRVDVALTATDVVDALAPVIQARGSRVEVSAPAAGTAVVAGERDQIFQVVQNLTENAVRYSPDGAVVRLNVETDLDLRSAQAAQRPGAPRLALLTPDRDEAARYVRVTVTDAGRGLARQHLPRLTERFFRVEGQKSGGEAGTGLGLSIVKHIVNRHRGGLIVESAEGEGSTFIVYLPMSPPRASAGRRNKTVTEL
ncbi:ATP-binding protein [Brevundimonas sp.]|uniref:sensor histidine kinase n=1 Tax=Brevundimonas sp. TaxID=1871086 RepID=UPI0025D2BBA5|nr:ATP-binding protein [Brevundimonas sp.]